MTTGRVLIVDDEPGLRHTLTRILRRAGCEVTAAADGTEALRCLADDPYDLAFLDIHLPGPSGLQVLQTFHRQRPDMPVVLLTAHGTLHSALQALRLGAADYLLKPVDPETLVARALVLLEEQAVRRRRREIEQQIALLQDELRHLDESLARPPAPEAPPAGERFLKRGPLILDRLARRATFGERVLALPPAAFDYLAALASHAPETVPYQALVAEAQGYQAGWRQARELAKWHVHQIRDSLEPDPRRPRYVLNVRGAGYRLVVD
jgi:DNA-binding response OmpR family regulator